MHFVMNSDVSDQPQNRDQVLQNLRDQNERMHLLKIITLVTIKIEEKFPTIAKAFLFFDVDDDRRINRTEFAKGLEGLRVKLNKSDVDKLFNYLDKDNNNMLDFQ